MQIPPSGQGDRRRAYADRRAQEKALVRVFDINGETVTSIQHHCLIVRRTRDYLRLISDEPLPVGERVDITFDLAGADGGKTFSGIPRNLAVAYESSGFLVDVDLIHDRHAASWKRQFH